MKAGVRPGKNSGRVRDAVRLAERAELNPIDFRCGTYYCRCRRNSSQVMRRPQRYGVIWIAMARIIIRIRVQRVERNNRTAWKLKPFWLSGVKKFKER
jgi:hypothetical protein